MPSLPIRQYRYQSMLCPSNSRAAIKEGVQRVKYLFQALARQTYCSGHYLSCVGDIDDTFATRQCHCIDDPQYVWLGEFNVSFELYFAAHREYTVQHIEDVQSCVERSLNQCRRFISRKDRFALLVPLEREGYITFSSSSKKQLYRSSESCRCFRAYRAVF